MKYTKSDAFKFWNDNNPDMEKYEGLISFLTKNFDIFISWEHDYKMFKEEQFE